MHIRHKFIIGFKHHKPALIIIAFVLAFLLSQTEFFLGFASSLGALSYLGAFVAGVMFSFIFTAPFAMAFFIESAPEIILLAALIAAFGSMIGDLFILKLVRVSFKKEFNEIRHNRYFKEAVHLARLSLGRKIRHYLLLSFIGIAIASPLPDEVGITLMSSSKKMDARLLAPLSFALHFAGILILFLV